jgi:predicted nucleic acid-binding protein
MRALVIDSSVVLQWVLAEHGTEAALDLLGSGRALVAPDIMLREIDGVIDDLVRLGMTPNPDVVALRRLLPELGVAIVESRPHFKAAIDIGMILGQPVLACTYLAIAMARGTRLVTGDKSFVVAARRHPRSRAHVTLLGERIEAPPRRTMASAAP